MSFVIFEPVVSAAIGALLGLLPALKDIAESTRRIRFRRDTKAAISGPGLSYEDLQHIAESWSQDRKMVLKSLRILLTEALTEQDPKLAGSAEAIRGLLREHRELEPYAELPENISIQLSAIASKDADLGSAVSQLASSLSELYSSHQKKILRQSRLAWAGLVIGVVGVAIGVASWVQ